MVTLLCGWCGVCGYGAYFLQTKPITVPASSPSSTSSSLSQPFPADWAKLAQKELKGKDPHSLVWQTAEVRPPPHRSCAHSHCSGVVCSQSCVVMVWCCRVSQ